MREQQVDDFDDYDESFDLYPEFERQVAGLESGQNSRAYEKIRRNRRSLRVRRNLEDWYDNRRIRNEIDYLD